MPKFSGDEDENDPMEWLGVKEVGMSPFGVDFVLGCSFYVVGNL